MKINFKVVVSALLLLVIGQLISVPTDAGQSLYFRSGTSRCCLPKYNYGDDDARIVAVVNSAKAIRVDGGTLSHGLIRRTVRVRSSVTTNGTTREVVEESMASVANPVASSSKRFVIGPAVAGPISMSVPGAVIYDSGEFRFSCTLTHSGGRFRNLSGNQCTVRVQGLRGSLSDLDDSRTTQTAPVLFEFTKNVRVSSSRPKTLMVTGADFSKNAKFFGEISHIRVYVECRLDR